VTVYLVRHAKAGSREKWKTADELRPLSKAGRRQATAIADALVGAGITRIISSPHLRCRQTVEPLAARCGVAIDVSETLAEGAPLDDALTLFDKVASETAVLCSHGDVIGALLWHFERHGVHLPDDRIEKGSTWVLEVDEGAVVAARSLPPPQ
jgi:broad specificity phosphatase PhoE